MPTTETLQSHPNKSPIFEVAKRQKDYPKKKEEYPKSSNNHMT